MNFLATCQIQFWQSGDLFQYVNRLKLQYTQFVLSPIDNSWCTQHVKESGKSRKITCMIAKTICSFWSKTSSTKFFFFFIRNIFFLYKLYQSETYAILIVLYFYNERINLFSCKVGLTHLENWRNWIFKNHDISSGSCTVQEAYAKFFNPINKGLKI